MKKLAVFVFLFLLCFLIFFLCFHKKEEKIMLKLEISGPKFLTINIGEKYNEPGFKAFVNNYDLTNKVKIIGNVNCFKSGNYEITYKIKYNNVSVIKHRIVKVTEKKYYKSEYDKLDNTVRGWWSNNKKDHTRPSGGADINELKKYNAYFLGKNEKVIYLTFDEGTLKNYVKEIVDVLNKNNVKATFFLCHDYMISDKDLIRKMVKSGHTIGNHTVNHKTMPSLATKEKFSEYLYEIEKVEKSYKEITGLNMDKVYRDPRGEWSLRDLAIVKDLGYKTYFYSADYMDFDGDVSKEYALNELMKRYHNGAIYLMHSKNKGNYLALDSFIKKMKSLGYRFDLVKNIP